MSLSLCHRLYFVLCNSTEEYELKFENFTSYLRSRGVVGYWTDCIVYGYKSCHFRGLDTPITEFDEKFNGHIRQTCEVEVQFLSNKDISKWKSEIVNDHWSDNEYILLESDMSDVWDIRTGKCSGQIQGFEKFYFNLSSRTKGWEILFRNRVIDRATLKSDNSKKEENREDNIMNIKIERVIFSNPATIVLWKDGTKTVAKCRKGDTYSKEAGLAICYMKKIMGSRKKFLKVMKKWIPETSKTEEKNPREGISFDEYLNEQLKDPEFKKQYENTEIINKEENNNGDKTAL